MYIVTFPYMLGTAIRRFETEKEAISFAESLEQEATVSKVVAEVKTRREVVRLDNKETL